MPRQSVWPKEKLDFVIGHLKTYQVATEAYDLWQWMTGKHGVWLELMKGQELRELERFFNEKTFQDPVTGAWSFTRQALKNPQSEYEKMLATPPWRGGFPDDFGKRVIKMIQSRFTMRNVVDALGLGSYEALLSKLREDGEFPALLAEARKSPTGNTARMNLRSLSINLYGDSAVSSFSSRLFDNGPEKNLQIEKQALADPVTRLFDNGPDKNLEIERRARRKRSDG